MHFLTVRTHSFELFFFERPVQHQVLTTASNPERMRAVVNIAELWVLMSFRAEGHLVCFVMDIRFLVQ